jgi:hypothetical protein
MVISFTGALVGASVAAEAAVAGCSAAAGASVACACGAQEVNRMLNITSTANRNVSFFIFFSLGKLSEIYEIQKARA